ncbi:MAG: hypothetical protein QW469_01165 [Candidatus Aenigmatarchaeota archaeon]
MKGNSNLLLIVAIILGILLLTGTIQLQGITQPTTGGVVSAGNKPTYTNCPDSKMTGLKIATRNNLNSSLQYLQATAQVIYSDESRPSGTVTSGADGLGSASNFECGRSVDLYFIGTSDYVSSAVRGVQLSGAQKEVYVDLPKSTDLQFLIYDESYNEVNGSSTYYKDVTVPSTAIPIGSGETKTYTIKVQTVSPSAEFGSDTLDNYIGIDYETSKFSKDNGMILSGDHVIGVADCPAYAYALGMDKCWKIKPIKSSEGTVQFTWTIKSDLGDPANDIKIQFFDGNYYLGNDGTIKAGIGDDSNSAIGQADRYIIFNIS